MNARVLILLLLLSPLGVAARGVDVAQLYDSSTLQYWGQRYPVSTRKIVDQVIWPALLSAEKRQFGRKPQLQFPRFARGESRNDPLAFYVPGNDRDPRNWPIVFPVFSLKFLDDLCTAYAWLQINGYSLETISEYNALLKYGTPPAGGWPSPLKALGIPRNALEDSRVDELALGHFVTARTFLLLHEMGHIFHGHHSRTYAESVRNEREADAFAARVMPRTGLPPLGILVFFLADAHWSGFPASGRDTHPLTGERVGALAAVVESPELAKKLRMLGSQLDDEDIRRGFAATGKAGDWSRLAPRRPGELPGSHAEKGAGTQAFDGYYRGKMVQFTSRAPFQVQVTFKRSGEGVTGEYSFGLGQGTIQGRIRGGQLHYEWRWAGNYGQGVLEADGEGGFRGRWGYRESNKNAGTWFGKRP